MFPSVEASHKIQARELVDDAASSICIDSQDYLELDEAIGVLQGQPEPQNDFDKYNQTVARQMVLDWDADISTIDLESLPEVDHTSNRSMNPHSLPHIKYDDFKIMVLGGCSSLISVFEMQEAISRDGPVGSIVGSAIGLMIYTFSLNGPIEMLAFQPFEGYGAYIGRYVHISLGIALDFTYLWSCIATAAQEVIVSILALTQFKEINTPDNSYIIWMVYIVVLMVALHLTSRDLRLALASFSSMLTVGVFITLSVMVILVITGHLPPYYDYVAGVFWKDGCGGMLQNVTCGRFQPRFGKAMGLSGRFCQVLDSTITAFRAAGTADKMFTLVPKVRNPRRSLPKTIKYSWARVVVIFMVPTMLVALGTAMNDPMFSVGQSVIAVKQFHNFTDAAVPSPNSTTTRVICPVELSKWKNFEDMRTFIPMSIPFIRANYCKMDQFVAAASVFFGFTSSLWYLIAANETIGAMVKVKPFDGLLCKKNPHNQIAILRLFNLVVLVGHVVGCWYGMHSFYRFVAVAQTSYVFLLMSLLNIAYIRFYYCIKLQTDGYVDRNDPHDWPYRAIGGKFCAYFCAIFSAGICFAQWPLYEGAFDYWAAWQFTASMSPILLTLVVAFVHWFKYRHPFVSLEGIDLAAAKRLLDEQEWVEDRVFRNGAWAEVYRWSAIGKRLLTAPAKALLRVFSKDVKKSEKMHWGQVQSSPIESS